MTGKRKVKTKISKNMQWAAPYLDAAPLIVRRRVVALRGHVVAPGYEVRALGRCAFPSRGKCTISICLNSTSGPMNQVSKLHRFEDLLFVLAHELAHTLQYDHTPAHLELTAAILKRFAKVAARENVKDTQLRLKRK